MWTLKLLRFDQVPSDFREPFIISGYRSYRSSAHSCLASALQRTNETLNFWTHFIPALFFLYLTFHLVVDHEINHGINPDRHYQWPFVVFLLGSCFYTLASSAAHMFNSMSQCARHIFFFLDYCGISIYSLSCCIAYYAYVFPPELLDTPLYHAYLPVAMVTAMCSTYLACCSRSFYTWPPIRYAGRLPAFMIPYIWCSAPLFYRVLFCESTGCGSEALRFHTLQFYWALVIAFFYATRIPEVIAPGTFDFIGHSHQVFHIGGAIITYCQYRAFLSELSERAEVIYGRDLPTFTNTFGVLLTVLVGNVIIIAYLSRLVIQMSRVKDSTHKH